MSRFRRGAVSSMALRLLLCREEMKTTLFAGALLLGAIGFPSVSAAGVDLPRVLRGRVIDEAGRGVAGAVLTLSTTSGREELVRSDAGGGFTFASADYGELRIEAGGFLPVDRRIEAGHLDAPLRLVLLSDTIAERITVTATRAPTRLGETASSTVILTAEDLGLSASPALDDALRQVPAFSLFRRSGSRTANPTTQGVSLRGTGASGASRALVLDDGVPLNDPFGGWISWGRVPRAAIQQVEIVRGGASDLYGGAALGGAIQLVRRGAKDTFGLAGEASYGSLGQAEGSFAASGSRGAWGAVLSADVFRTDGYVLVDDVERGPVDTPAASRHAAVDLTVERATDSGRLFLRGSRFEEERQNGTPLQDNDTRTLHMALGAEGLVGGGAFSARAYGTDQDFRQSFSAVDADRASERLTRLQDVPSDAAGLVFQWTRALGGSHLLVAGLEARQVRGESREEIFAGESPTFVDSGGRERTAAVFLEDIMTLSARWTLTASLRWDRWWNQDGRSAARASSDAAPVITLFPDRSETAWSPRVSAIYRLLGPVSLTASAYRSFRVPTLNELYRDFRVGNTLTLANAGLDPERAGGGEVGVIYTSRASRLSARATAFWMEIADAIGNVTLTSTPALITRQRRNVGTIRSLGVETDLDWRLSRHWKISGGYQFADSTVRSSPAEPELRGLRVPQVPQHRLTLQPSWTNPAIGTVAVTLRWTSLQFEDDQNLLPLESFWTIDAFLSRNLGRALQAFVAAENLMDDRYDIGRTPVRTVGPPRTFRGGIRLRLPA